MRSRRGWVFIDVVMAIILVSIIAAMLSAAADWHQRALRHLTDSRSATRLAESAISSMQSGQTPSQGGDSGLTFHKLSASSDFPGKTWVQVEATVGNRRASLIGLVPQNALPGGGS
jgi:type II secretory pathway pseudopilin PulG